MKSAYILALACAFAAPQIALAGSPPTSKIIDPKTGRVVSTDVKTCVGTGETNDQQITQNSDLNIAGCVQAGRDNTVIIDQQGSSGNFSGVGQGEIDR